MSEKDPESQRPVQLSNFKQVISPAGVTKDVEEYKYDGAGTDEDPYVVVWIDEDPRNPMNWTNLHKWSVTMLVAVALLAVAFDSSAYSGGSTEIIREFQCPQIVFSLGISLFVLGFALGPLLWAPLSELVGRQPVFLLTYAVVTVFNGATIASKNIQTLVILRFFAGAFGASPLTNAGGVIADMFSSRDRGLALSLFSAAPFLGPVLGPIVGGFVGETVGWRWIMGVVTIFTGVLFLALLFFLPETYAPAILRARAKALSKQTGKVYRSRGDVEQGPTTLGHVMKTSLSRPWVLLFREPIVLLLSLYLAIIYGTLYGLFGAFPIVYQQTRGWSAGIGALPFLGVMVGMIAAVAYAIVDNRRFERMHDKHNGFPPPEARIPPTLIASIAIPIGLIWFAWTNSPSIHWIVSVIATVPFGFGMVLIFIGVFNYLIDAYTIFSASVLAANTVLRSVVGAAFPLFVPYMYDGLGIHWATMIPGFLALACVPFPFLFYKYGAAIRKRCKYAAESEAFLRRMQEQQDDDESSEEDEKEEEEETAEAIAERERNRGVEEREELKEVGDSSAAMDAEERHDGLPALQPIRTARSRRSSRGAGLQRTRTYESNPFDLDRVNTRESFARQVTRSRADSEASRK
ncbi:Major facilitator superfamily multidrug transporter mdrA [Pseudocercospora fuligena]|uniref:Major facilitator superfamily multidrug transporter mdrA n=1 Tax=Pseudocercospora fuligena TaxID=685502 RepID=A0A8H6RVJ3_9PEZI|nr:Major facilitator superfamily multidrug transporter mdrA [Pseudocercospora fuligena]